jgi:hypothetical protein
MRDNESFARLPSTTTPPDPPLHKGGKGLRGPFLMGVPWPGRQFAAGQCGTSGTSPGGLDSSSGPLSALGGEGVHAMSFTGAEILPNANPFPVRQALA